MHELMTHVARKRPVKWFEVGIELQIDTPILEAYDAEYSNHNGSLLRCLNNGDEKRHYHTHGTLLSPH